MLQHICTDGGQQLLSGKVAILVNCIHAPWNGQGHMMMMKLELTPFTSNGQRGAHLLLSLPNPLLLSMSANPAYMHVQS